jgi:hypothetical protein
MTFGGAGAAWGHVRISQTGPPAVLRRLRREMQSTSTVRQAETSWQPSTLGFNGEEPRLLLRESAACECTCPEAPVSQHVHLRYNALTQMPAHALANTCW